METLEQEIAKKQAAHEAEIAALMAKHKVLAGVRAKLGTRLDGYVNPMVHSFKLYGSQGTIAFNWEMYDSIRKGNNPDRALLSALLEAFPPMELVKVRSGGCTSFRPQEWYQERERDEVYECGPVKVDIDGLQADEAEFEWYAKVGVDGGEQTWRICVKFPMYRCGLGGVQSTVKNWDSKGRPCAWTWNYHASNQARESGVQHIRFAGVDYANKSPNHFTLYWDRDSGWEMVRSGGIAGLVKEDTAGVS